METNKQCPRKRRLESSLANWTVTRRETFEHLITWLEDVKQHGNEEIKTILIANKADAAGDRKVSREEGEAFATKYGLLYTEASAKTGENVANAFLSVAKVVFDSLSLGSRDVSTFREDEIRKFEANGVKFGPRRVVNVEGGPVRIDGPTTAAGKAASSGGCC
ncbi:hypothetical protein HDU98_011421 [Podochytrium sp. JEL0797]|nr:hypothetical protein HDU98_011421 [Podochytrium sp. JEL0797]